MSEPLNLIEPFLKAAQKKYPFSLKKQQGVITMNLDDLTLGQIKQLKSIIGGDDGQKKDPASHMIGKCCMFRTYSAGVHFGVLVEKNEQTCLVKNSQRIYSWVKACSLSQLAMEGSKNLDACRISIPVDEIVLEQVIEIIPMPESTVAAFREVKQWKS